MFKQAQEQQEEHFTPGKSQQKNLAPQNLQTCPNSTFHPWWCQHIIRPIRALQPAIDFAGPDTKTNESD